MAIAGGLQQVQYAADELPEPYIVLNTDRVGQLAVTAKSLTSNVATITTSEKHYYSVGVKVIVSGILDGSVLDTTFNGEYEITAVTDYTFSYAKTHADVVEVTGITMGTVAKKYNLVFYAKYQVISQDKNEFSASSPIYAIHAPYWFKRPDTFTINTGINVAKIGSNAVHINWEPISLMIKDNKTRNAQYYDVWVNWKKSGSADGVWVYSQRIFGNSTTLNIPSSYTTISGTTVNNPNQIAVEVRMRGNPITRTDTRFLLAYETNGYVSP